MFITTKSETMEAASTVCNLCEFNTDSIQNLENHLTSQHSQIFNYKTIMNSLEQYGIAVDNFKNNREQPEVQQVQVKYTDSV